MTRIIEPDESPRARVNPTPTDTVDLSNFQGGGGWLGVAPGDTMTRLTRFVLNYTRCTSGVVMLELDTAVRSGAEPPDLRTADSVAIAGLGRLEQIARICRLGAHRIDERFLGIVPDTFPEKWMRPRLAWFIDTLTVRIRRASPNSLSCMLDAGHD